MKKNRSLLIYILCLLTIILLGYALLDNEDTIDKQNKIIYGQADKILEQQHIIREQSELLNEQRDLVNLLKDLGVKQGVLIEE